MSTFLRTSPRKARRPQQRSLALREAISAVAVEYERMTVRQLFYQLVARRSIEKTERAYKRVCDASAQMRLDGSLPYRKIADGHRSRRVPLTYEGLSEVVQITQDAYRRNYWAEQPVNVEIWCEKDALTGVILPICTRYGVPYVATKGFPSITLIYESAREMIYENKPTHVYYFGDHDASGRAISENLEEDLSEHGADVTVTRVALEPWQIEAYHLPTRPGKESDSRYASFAAEYGNACVELDALPPNVLTELVVRVIQQEIDPYAWQRMKEIEMHERATLQQVTSILQRVSEGDLDE